MNAYLLILTTLSFAGEPVMAPSPSPSATIPPKRSVGVRAGVIYRQVMVKEDDPRFESPVFLNAAAKIPIAQQWTFVPEAEIGQNRETENLVDKEIVERVNVEIRDGQIVNEEIITSRLKVDQEKKSLYIRAGTAIEFNPKQSPLTFGVRIGGQLVKTPTIVKYNGVEVKDYVLPGLNFYGGFNTDVNISQLTNRYVRGRKEPSECKLDVKLRAAVEICPAIQELQSGTYNMAPITCSLGLLIDFGN